MLIPTLAYRNLVGAGLRTWLNVSVLAFAYVLIIWHQGLFSGMLKQSMQAVVSDEIAGGQYWHNSYDPYDILSLDESHGAVPQELEKLSNQKKAAPVLIRQATIYPQGRVQSALIRGIDPDQHILDIPTSGLNVEKDVLPIMIGSRMAAGNSLEVGDFLMIRWRDANGTFDAKEGKIVQIMNTQVVTIDKMNLWAPIKHLQQMTGLEGHATMIIVGQDVPLPELSREDTTIWQFKGHDFLLKELYDMIKTKRVSSLIMYSILLFLAMLAIFDTQILSIWRRKKEIGTLMALGMTRIGVVSLFTLEGIMHGILAIGVAAVIGTPIIIYSAKTGLEMPGTVEDYGFALSKRLFPSYSVGLVAGTIVAIMITVTIVSYMPSRNISKMNPTEALKGK